MATMEDYCNNCISLGSYGSVIDGPGRKPPCNIIKWYRVKMTLDEKARFNLLTYEEYLEWIKELEERSKEQDKTFWASDTEERSNVSEDEYEAFLSANNVDVSNSTSVDFDALKQQIEGGDTEEKKPQPEEPSMDEILSSVNAANHGGDKILSPEEIAALFAAAEGQN